MGKTGKTGMTGIFISYRQADSKAWSAFLRGELKTVFGEEFIFLDRDALRAGKWQDQISSALDNCCAMLVVIGPNWISLASDDGQRRLDADDDVHRAEIAAGLADQSVTVIPVLVEGASMPTAAQLPAPIRALAQCQARQFSVKESHRLADLRELCDDLVRAGAVPIQDSANPWAAGAQAAAAHTPVASAVTYVARVVDEDQAREAFESWLARQTNGTAAGAPRATRLKSLELWWVPYWQVGAAVSAAWQGRASATLLPADPARSHPAGGAGRMGDGLLQSGFLEPAPLRTYLAATEVFGSELPQLLDDNSQLKVVDSDEAIDTIGQEAGLTVLEGQACAHAKADFRKATLDRLRQQYVDGVLDVTHLDVSIDDFSTQLVWCPVWRGSCFDGATVSAFWVLGDTGQVVASAGRGLAGGATAAVAVAPGLPPRAVARRKKRPVFWLAAGALGLAYLVHASRSPDPPEAKVADAAAARARSAAAAGSAPARSPSVPALAGSEPAATRNSSQVSPKARASETRAGRPDVALAVAVAASAAFVVSAPPVVRDAALLAPPAATAAGLPQAGKRAAEPRPQASGLAAAPPPPGGPLQTAQSADQPPALEGAAAAAPHAKQALDEACGRRYLGAYARCMRVQCVKPEFQALRVCMDFKEREAAERKRPDVHEGG